MRQILLLSVLLLGGLAPAFGLKPVTVAQLEEMLAGSHDQSDAKLASELTQCELTERVSDARLAHWEADFQGARTREALTELADASSFEDLPGADLPADAAPDRERERQMLSRVIDYAAKVIPTLPDFMATRETIHFEDSPPREHIEASGAGTGADYHTMRTENFSTAMTKYEPLHVTGKFSFPVTYRDGKEVDDLPGRKKAKREDVRAIGLTTSGEFGPILSVVLNDAFRSHMQWGYWERGSSAAAAGGLVAVYRYQVPQAQSHYLLEFFSGAEPMRVYPAYRGEIAIDPATGSVLRLTLTTELTAPFAMTFAAVRVDYGPVVIGDRTYICPVKGVALSRMPEDTSGWSGSGLKPPLETRLNDVTFTNYHRFRADVRIIGAPGGMPGGTPGAAGGEEKAAPH